MTKMVLSTAYRLFAEVAAPAAPTAPAASGTTSTAPVPPLNWGSLAIPVLFAAGFYFLLIAPQMKRKKEQDKMLTGLQVGDEIVSTGGIFGVITSVKDDRFVVRIADNTKIELAKAFIHAAVKPPGSSDKK